MPASNSKRLASIIFATTTVAVLSYIAATFWVYQNAISTLEVPEYSGPDIAPQELQAKPESVATTEHIS